jgi:diguanylate cyclase (GGDEF)-like protein
MSHPESVVKTKTPVHWTVKTNYRLRTGSFAIMFTSIVFHGWDKGYSPVFWGLIALHLLAYPHLMFWRARRAANSQNAEVNNLAVDSFLFGILAAALQFPLWISFTVYIASTLNITISRGTKGMLLSQLAFFGGALISIGIFGWHVSPETGWPATLMCLAGNTVYMISIGVAAFGRNQQLRKTREALREGEQTLKQQLAEIQNLQEKLQEQASRDPLTGMYNRRFLDSMVAREIARCRREKTPLTVMMIDVDHFKKVNDTYGHPGGDEVLKNLAALLIGRVRVTDVPCRYGGEEFLLLLPGMAPDIAMLRANTWRTAFAEMSSTLDGVTIKATMSIGVAIYPEHGDTITELTHCADLALYRAKEEGRNRAIMYTEELAKAKS